MNQTRPKLMMQDRLRWAALLAIAAALTAMAVMLLPWSSDRSEAGATRMIEVSPASGIPGQNITVSGTGGWINPSYQIYWDEKGGELLGDFVPGVDFSWDETVAVPSDATPGDYQIVACEGVGGDFQDCESADFTVLSALGDADCNGVVNAIDAAFILQFAAALLSELPCPDNADVNGDGNHTAVDAALILQFSAGLLGSLPP